MTTPDKVTLTAVGGEPKAFISTKCSFLSFCTSTIVYSNYLLASATEASAYAAKFVASSVYFCAIASSLATIF